jgi:hypothetical protein
MATRLRESFVWEPVLISCQREYWSVFLLLVSIDGLSTESMYEPYLWERETENGIDPCISKCICNTE